MITPLQVAINSPLQRKRLQKSTYVSWQMNVLIIFLKITTMISLFLVFFSYWLTLYRKLIQYLIFIRVRILYPSFLIGKKS